MGVIIFLQHIASIIDEGHNLAVILTSGAENADVTFIREGRTETTDDKGGVGRFADGIFVSDKNIERLVRRGFAEPGFEIV